MEINKLQIKAITSCIRNTVSFEEICKNGKLVDINSCPTAGDLAVLKIENKDVGYGKMEILNGSNYELQNNDYIIAVIGNRYSGTNVYGEIDDSEINKNDLLFQISISGIFAKTAFVENMHNSGQATVAKVVGFISSNNKIVNLKKINKVEVNEKKSNACTHNFFVFGTSAEVGKTTFVCNFCKLLKSKVKNVSCAKVCGTGRLKDKLKYKEAGADFCIDYVDIGLPSTYKLSRSEILKMIKSLFIISNQNSNYNLYEVGGDMLEGGADIILKYAIYKNAFIFIVINDAMGALTAKRMLKKYRNYAFISWRPNIKALSERINEQVYNIYTFQDIEKLEVFINE